jgi:hypothetical protein
MDEQQMYYLEQLVAMDTEGFPPLVGDFNAFDGLDPFQVFAILAEIEIEKAEIAAQERRVAKLLVFEAVVDDAFVFRNEVIPRVIAGTATTVPLRCSPGHHRRFALDGLSTYLRKTYLREGISELDPSFERGN